MPEPSFFPEISRPIILASKSPRRANLLQQIGLEFNIQPADVNESELESSGKSPERVATLLASRKAQAIAEQIHPDTAYIIGADTVVSLGESILAKPRDRKDAKTILERLSGESHTVITGVSIITVPDTQEITFAESTEVHFRDLTDAEIDTYIASGEPMDKAGAYGIQGLGALFVEYIHGDYNNVVGFPLTAFYRHFLHLRTS